MNRDSIFKQCGKGVTRRKFIKQTSVVVGACAIGVPKLSYAFNSTKANGVIGQGTVDISLGYQGSQKLSVKHLNLLGSRVYDKRISRFMQHDNMDMSPFGKGGVHGYAFVDGDPINNRDPSGQFAILSILVGAVVGAIVGAAVSAISEGIKVANKGGSFDWKQVVIGASVGALSGGLGAASSGASGVVKAGMAVADAATSGAAEFGINVAFGEDVKSAGISSATGAVIGLATFGVGVGAGKSINGLSKLQSRLDSIKSNGLSGRGAPKAAKAMAKTSQNQGETLSVLERLAQQPTIFDSLNKHLDNRTVGRLRCSSRQLSATFEETSRRRRETLRRSLHNRIDVSEPILANNSRLQTRLGVFIEAGIHPHRNQHMKELLMERFAALSEIQMRALREQKTRFPADYAATIAKYPHLPHVYVDDLG